jgi:hypothetical protein
MLTQIILLPVLYFIVADVDRLLVHAEPAVASISPQPGGRKFIRLPDLEFPLHINAYCGAGRTPESISVSIADSNKTISGEDLGGEDLGGEDPASEDSGSKDLPVSVSLDTSVRIASRQIAPIAIRGFCVTGNEAPRSLLVATALTAQFSLRCVRDDKHTIVFRARALDVVLNCETGTTTAPGQAAVSPPQPDFAAGM